MAPLNAVLALAVVPLVVLLLVLPLSLLLVLPVLLPVLPGLPNLGAGKTKGLVLSVLSPKMTF